MIKFEEHDGMLFRMLEEPTPLTPDAEMPCLVRLIQDDSPMGRHNKFACSPLMKNNNPIIIDSIKENAVSIAFNHMVFHYSNFEIIGYPVADGSKEWAWYQMMQGKKVMNIEWINRKSKDLKYCCCENGMLVYNPEYVLANPLPIVDFLTPLLGLVPISDGWQIYKEPKPSKPKYRVGDSVICEYHRSPLPKQISYERVIDVDDVTVITQSQNGSVCAYDINGNHGDINGWHIDRVISPCEHIVTIGCLSGTVRPVSTNGTHIWFHLIGVDDRIIATIRISSLDTQTRELVESLLKAQEEDK